MEENEFYVLMRGAYFVDQSRLDSGIHYTNIPLLMKENSVDSIIRRSIEENGLSSKVFETRSFGESPICEDTTTSYIKNIRNCQLVKFKLTESND